jgi:hypothetical protein
MKPDKFLLPLLSPLLFLMLAARPSAVLAHRVDEYLQATIVVVEPDRVRLRINLTPGVAVAENVLRLVDRDRDGVISTYEAAAYCELLKRDLIVQLDHRNVKLKCTASYFPGVVELRSGWGFIQMEFSAKTDALAMGPHKLSIENRHLPKLSVYLINAGQSASASIEITEQIRIANQSTGDIRFILNPRANSS